MPESPECVDLRSEADSRLALAALAALRELRPGQHRVLLTREDPALLMASLNLHLRDALAWETAALGGHWRTVVRPAADSPPRDVLDTLTRDHRRLDELLGRALRRLNAGDVGHARTLLTRFSGGLRRHVGVEDDLLAGELGPGTDFAPLGTMRREHGDLVEQLRAVDACFAEAAAGELPQAWELEPFVAILSGTLAKHEHREETALFHAWAAALAERSPDEREALHARVRAALAA